MHAKYALTFSKKLEDHHFPSYGEWGKLYNPRTISQEFQQLCCARIMIFLLCVKMFLIGSLCNCPGSNYQLSHFALLYDESQKSMMLRNCSRNMPVLRNCSSKRCRLPQPVLRPQLEEKLTVSLKTLDRKSVV